MITVVSVPLFYASNALWTVLYVTFRIINEMYSLQQLTQLSVSFSFLTMTKRHRLVTSRVIPSQAEDTAQFLKKWSDGVSGTRDQGWESCRRQDR